MGKQILITGTNSYVGTSFKQYIEKKNGNMPLEDRWHVTFVSVRNSEWKKMDFSKYDTILHVAAIVHQKEQPDMETLYYNVNTKLTVELAEKAKNADFAIATTVVGGNIPCPVIPGLPLLTGIGVDKLFSDVEEQMKK